jgi:site-specific DNA-methyltransferase (adenine-specific)
MIEINRNYNESNLETMAKMPDCFVDLIITSPPYFLNKEYEKTIKYEDYLIMMENIFIESNRVLKGGGYLVVNFGDYFNSGNRFYHADIPACYPASINYFKWGVEIAKMDLQATRIWRKQFAKMGIPFVCNKHPRPVFDYEHIWTFRKKNGMNEEIVYDRKLSQRGVIGEDWTSKADIKTHCAAFPIELPSWVLNVYSKKGDLIYDPFMGSGTTALSAIKNNRDWIGSEISSEYCNIIEERIKKAWEEKRKEKDLQAGTLFGNEM